MWERIFSYTPVKSIHLFCRKISVYRCHGLSVTEFRRENSGIYKDNEIGLVNPIDIDRTRRHQFVPANELHEL